MLQLPQFGGCNISNIQLQIGEIARRAGVTIRTVRYYEEKGLLPPSGLTSGGIRLYAEKDLNRLVFIRRLKLLDLNIEEIRTALVMPAENADHTVRAEHTLKLLRIQVDKLQNEITRLSDLEKEVQHSVQLVTRCLGCRAEECPERCPSAAHVL